MSDTSWFVRGAEGDSGPCGIETLTVMARNGGLSAETLVREAADAGWRPAAERLPGLFVAPPQVAGDGWTDRAPHAWRRYAARLIDNMVCGLLTWTLISILAFSVAPAEADAFFSIFKVPGGQILDGILTLIAAIPGNAALIGLTGLSLGKWIFGVRVLRAGKPIGFLAALNREGEIWWRALAGGIPILSLITLIISYNSLCNDPPHVTPWDQRQGNEVVQRPETPLATAGMIVAAIVFISLAIATRLFAYGK